MSAAQRLDAADGVMDGRFQGRPIVQAGGFPQQQFGGFPQQQFGGFPQQQFGGFPQQQFGGFPQQFGGQSAAARLDAADGVIDGRFHGRPIVQAGGQQFGGFPQQQFGGFPQQFGGFPQQFGTVGGFPQAGFAPTSNAAALDAADGVIDGRFHGRPIVQAGGPQFGGFPQQFGGGFSQVVQGQPSFIQAPPIVTNQPMGFPQGGFVQGGFPQGGFGGQGAAARLDAADGVIDGQFFGRPIVRGA